MTTTFRSIQARHDMNVTADFSLEAVVPRSQSLATRTKTDNSLLQGAHSQARSLQEVSARPKFPRTQWGADCTKNTAFALGAAIRTSCLQTSIGQKAGWRLQWGTSVAIDAMLVSVAIFENVSYGSCAVGSVQIPGHLKCRTTCLCTCSGPVRGNQLEPARASSGS